MILVPGHFVYLVNGKILFRYSSSHFNMKIIVNIEIVQATTNTVHVIQIGIDSYGIAPITSN